MTGKIVLLGATGYTGGLVLSSLLARGLRPTLAGRNATALRALAAQHGALESVVVDAADLAALRRLVSAGDVLVTTVGPFDRLGRAVAQAAVDQGAHYVDSTGELGFVRWMVDTLHVRATQTGAVLLPAFGYDYVPGFLAGALALERAGARAHSLEVAYFAEGTDGGGLSRGTRRTLLEELGHFVPVRADGVLRGERMASRVGLFEVGGRRQDTVLAGGTETLFLPRHWPVADVRVYNGWFPGLGRVLQVTSAVASGFTSTAVGERAVAAASDRVAGGPAGPDEGQRARSRTAVVAQVRDSAGTQVARAELVGPNPYTLTGELMAWAAGELAAGRGRMPGVVDGFTAFGTEALRGAAAEMGLTER